jgi:hypothetical protein
MATLTDVVTSLDNLAASISTLTAQEAGEVAVQQADLDALAAKVGEVQASVQALIDAKTPA